MGDCRGQHGVGDVIFVTHNVKASDLRPWPLGAASRIQRIFIPVGRPGEDKFVSHLDGIKRRHVKDMNQMHHRGSALIMSGANIELGCGVRGNQAVAEVKGDVIQVSDIRVSIPIPTNDIAGFHLAERRHFHGITRRNEDGVNNSAGGGFSVGRRGPAGNVHAGAAHVRLTANATGNEVCTIVARRINGAVSKYADAIETEIRIIRVGPEITVAADVSGVVVGVGDGAGAVELIGIAATDNDLHGRSGAEIVAAGVVHLEAVGVGTGRFRGNKLATEGGGATGRDVFATGDCTTGKMSCAATGIRNEGKSSEAVLADEIQGIATASPCGGAAIGHGPGLGEDGPGHDWRAIGDGNGKDLVAINGKAAAHHGYAKAQNDNNKTCEKSYWVFFHIYWEKNADKKFLLTNVSGLISERSCS